MAKGSVSRAGAMIRAMREEPMIEKFLGNGKLRNYWEEKEELYI